MINDLPYQISRFYSYSQDTGIEFIFQDENGFVDSILSNLKKYKADLVVKVKQIDPGYFKEDVKLMNFQALENILDSNTINKLNHFENIKRRVEYLNLIQKHKLKST